MNTIGKTLLKLLPNNIVNITYNKKKHIIYNNQITSLHVRLNGKTILTTEALSIVKKTK